MADFAITARPPKAAIAWATRDGLFCEIPCKDGPPLIVRYHCTEEGLRLALNVLVKQPEAATRTIQRSHAAIKFGPKPAFTEDQRRGVRDVLKKIGIT